MGHDNERRTNVDVSEKDLKKLKIGEKVVATVEGTVFELTDKNPYGAMTICCDREEERDIPPSIGIKISKVVIASAKKNAFSEMSKDDEREE